MKIFDSIVLYVEDIAATMKFYSEILGRELRLLAPTFVALDPDEHRIRVFVRA
ncbi:MAG TPA: VOC family protein [Rectinemataceae bacterium]|nr:VOC family protein [Rectinemataceae bacterium]